MRYLLQLSFNGTNYHGWQKQQNANTVQAEIEKAMSLILRVPTEVTGCGRTDTGVHAREFFLHVDSEVALDEQFIYRMNKLLPPDIALYTIKPVSSFFHARFDADYREYHYFLHQHKNAFIHTLSWYKPTYIDFEQMNEAASVLLTCKDFKCFSKANTQVYTFLCDLHLAQWEQVREGEWVFKIKANRFLRNMVRAIVGTLIEVGRNELSMDQLKQILDGGNRSEAGQSVPAHGLFLQKVHYPEDVFDLSRKSFREKEDGEE